MKKLLLQKPVKKVFLQKKIKKYRLIPSSFLSAVKIIQNSKQYYSTLYSPVSSIDPKYINFRLYDGLRDAFIDKIMSGDKCIIKCQIVDGYAKVFRRCSLAKGVILTIFKEEGRTYTEKKPRKKKLLKKGRK